MTLFSRAVLFLMLPRGITRDLSDVSPKSSSAAAASQPMSVSPAQIDLLRTTLRNAVARDGDFADLLGLCAENNTWTVEEAMSRPHEITYLELFLLQVRRVPILSFFPNLTVVKLMSVGLESMVDLASLANVEELWLVDNNIRHLESLESMSKLRRLYLQGNCITSMENLPPLRHLRELWLSRNKITNISHLNPLRKLRIFHIAENPITHLDGAFGKDLVHLHDMNLSGCGIYAMTELVHLKSLPCLRNLWLSDPLFGDNPVCHLNNYATFALHLLDSLETLDGNYITPDQQNLADSIVQKKCSYYRMRQHTVDIYFHQLAQKAEERAAAKVKSISSAIQVLHSFLHPIDIDLTERQVYKIRGGTALASSEQLSTSELEQVRQKLLRAIDTREVEDQMVLRRLASAMEASERMKENLKERLSVELNTAGNIRIEPLNVSDALYRSAAEVVEGRFQEELYSSRFGISKVSVQRVSRLVNRGLRLRFDNRIKELHVNLADPKQRSRFVCLFGAVPLTAESQAACLQHVLLHGPSDRGFLGAALPAIEQRERRQSSTLSKGYCPIAAGQGVPLTNSLFYADEERLLQWGRAGSFSSGLGSSNPPVYTGQVILYRVFLGKTVHALGSGGGGGGQAPTSFISTGQRVMAKDYGNTVFAAYRSPPREGATSNGDDLAGNGDNEASAAPCVWYCFDRALLLPDCVVEYVYTTVAPLLATPTLDVANATAMKELLKGIFPSVPVDDSSRGDTASDLIGCAAALIEFINWSKSSTTPLQVAAEAECKRAIEAVEELMGKAAVAALISAATRSDTVERDQNDSQSPRRELRSADISSYADAVQCSQSSTSLTYCSLYGKKLHVVPINLKSTFLSAVTTLNLSNNLIQKVSWHAIASEVPLLETLILSRNRLTSFDIGQICIMQLKSLDLTFNQLSDVDEFREIRSVMPQLENLLVRGNPMVSQPHRSQYAVAQLWVHFTTSAFDASSLQLPSMPRLDRRTQHQMAGTLSQSRAERAAICSIAGDGICASVVEYVACTAQHLQQQGYSSELFSLHRTKVPDGAFSMAVSQLLALEPGEVQGYLRRVLPTISRAPGGRSLMGEMQSFSLHNALLRELKWASTLLPNVAHLSLRGHCLTQITPLLSLSRLETLDISDNCITSLPSLGSLKQLQEICVDFNAIESLPLEVGPLPSLRRFSACGNRISVFDPMLFMSGNATAAAATAASSHTPTELTLSTVGSPRNLQQQPQVVELYLSNNNIAELSLFYPLRELSSLLILSVAGNPCIVEPMGTSDGKAKQAVHRTDEEARLYFVHLFQQLKVLDGQAITAAELVKARETHAGRMTTELLTERANGAASTWPRVHQLDLSHCSLKEVSLLERFSSLEVLQLHHNLLTQVACMSSLTRLKALQLSHNRLGGGNWRPQNTAAAVALGDALAPLRKLESLSLESNQIADLAVLKLRLPSLKFLNLRGNELTVLQQGLQQLPDLRELLVDQNKLRSMTTDCFSNCRKLVVLSAEDNALRTVDGIQSCTNLEVLRLGANRLGEMQPLLASVGSCRLNTAVFLGNPVARKSNYRNTIIAHFPQLVNLDRRDVTPQDRMKAEAARATELVAPPNVVIDMNYLAPPLNTAGFPLNAGASMTPPPYRTANLPAATQVAGGPHMRAFSGPTPTVIRRQNAPLAMNGRSRPLRR